MKLRMIGFWILACVVISALFNSLFGFVFLGFVFDPFIILGQAVSSAGFWLILLFLILILSTLYPRLWCNSFCPLGRFYSIIGILLGKIKNSR
ncbi:MAG: 4Fe-4S binding protein, partial [Candidatus Omnitrophica bacterium]|nr:4Fe-4S binding protein [Candidatus Omnitrophota bacterium]